MSRRRRTQTNGQSPATASVRPVPAGEWRELTNTRGQVTERCCRCGMAYACLRGYGLWGTGLMVDRSWAPKKSFGFPKFRRARGGLVIRCRGITECRRRRRARKPEPSVTEQELYPAGWFDHEQEPRRLKWEPEV